MSHWAAEYIGQPWVSGDYDCWVFFREIQKKHFRVDVPIVDIDSTDLMQVARRFRDDTERGRWRKVGTPQDGDAVLMSHSRFPSHIGVWVDVDGGGVLHCQERTGVVFQKQQDLLLGSWPKLEFYRCSRTV